MEDVKNNEVVNIQKLKSEKLADTAYAYLDEGEYEQALEISRQLEKMRYTAAFEIGAIALDSLGETAAAVDLLERGMGLADDVWINWQLLGNLYSDLDEFQKANAAYKNALDCVGVIDDSVNLNLSILHYRNKNYSKALALLGAIKDEDFAYCCTDIKVSSLFCLNKIDEAASLAEKTMQSCRDILALSERDLDAVGRMTASLGSIKLSKGEDKQQVKIWVMEQLLDNISNDALLTLVRDIDSIYSTECKYYRLLVECKLPEISNKFADASGYFVSYDIIADDLGEALDYVAEFEDKDLRGNMQVEEVEELKHKDTDQKGVYWRSVKTFYD